VEEWFAAMQAGVSANKVQTKIIPSLMWEGQHPAEIVEIVVNRTMQIADEKGLGWDRNKEQDYVISRILSAYHNLLEKGYDPSTGVVPAWVPAEFHDDWVKILLEGRRPTITRNGSSWFVRRVKEANQKIDDNENRTDGVEDTKGTQPGAPFILRPFKAFDLATLPPREFLFGKHYQRCTVGGTVAPGGTGKSTLEMVEAVSMSTARNLLNEPVKDRLRVWYHNGEDNMDELKRRVGAICQHYNVPLEELEGWFFMTTGNEVPLKVAQGYNNLHIDQRLIKCIIEQISDNEIDVATFDPLITLHSVPEKDTTKMDMVIRIFAKIAQDTNSAVEISHHTRKLQAGSAQEDLIIDDMRGPGALKDAMRAVRILNYMSRSDADNAGIDEFDRTSYFRVDRGKANNSPPAKAAIWRKFVNEILPNLDEVGVIVPWSFPGADAPPSPQRIEAELKAERIFLEILARLTLAGRFVIDSSGPSSAAFVFAKEKEARMAKVGKAALADAMRRLFDKGKIRIEDYVRANRHPARRIIAT
jgi:RecA-family ATPase